MFWKPFVSASAASPASVLPLWSVTFPPPDVQALLHLLVSRLFLPASVLGCELTGSCSIGMKAFSTNPFSSVSL